MSQRPLKWYEYFTMNSWFVGLGFMWNSIHRFILPAMLPILVGTSTQATALSQLQFAGLIVALLVQPISGAISDRSLSRFGRRRPMMVEWTLVDLVFLAGIAFAPNLVWLFLAYVGLQAASNMAHGPAQGLIPDLAPENQRGAASGVKNFIDNFTLILAGLITGAWVLSSTPDLILASRIAILFIGIGLVLFLIVNVLTTHEKPITKDELPGESLRDSVLRSLSVVGNISEVARENRPYGWLLISRLLFYAAVNIVANYAQFYFKDIVLVGQANAAQEAPKLMGTLAVIVAVMLVLVSIPAGMLSDRVGRKPVSAVGGLVAIAGALLLLTVKNVTLVNIGGFGLTDLMVAGLLIGVGAGIYFAANWAWATDLISDRDAARYLGISNLATAGGGVIATIGGPIIDFGNARSLGLGYEIAFGIGAAWFLLSIILLPLIQETRGRASSTLVTAGH